MSQESILVIHEVGEPGHYAGLAAAMGDSCPLEYVEFSVGLLLYRGAKKRSPRLVFKALRDFIRLAIYFLFPFLLKNRIVVLGIAPLDWRICLLARAVKHASTIYHTSWTEWDGSFFPRGSYSLRQRDNWKEFLSRVAAIAAVTPRARDSLLANWGVSDNVVVRVVYHSYDKSIFNTGARISPGENSPWGLRLVFAGRLVPEKGIEALLRLAASRPWLSLTIIGDGPLRSLVTSESSTRQNVVYRGYVSDKRVLADIYKESDVVVQPSLRTEQWEELFGMALVEAMACGCVPIASAHAGPQLIINDPEMSRICLVDESEFYHEALNLLDELCENSGRLSDLSIRSIRAAESYERRSISMIWSEIIASLKSGAQKRQFTRE